MKLLPEEMKLQEIGSLTLTNYRVHKTGGYTSTRRVREVASIRIEHVTHCQITSTDSPALIVVGVLGAIAGGLGSAYTNAPAPFILGAIFCAILIVSYFTQRHCEIEIASPTLTLYQPFDRKSLSFALDFIGEMERAAIERASAHPEPAKVIIKKFVPERPTEKAEYWGG